MKKLVLCLLIHFILVNADWESLIPPAAASARGTLIGTFSRCAEDTYTCEVIYAWSAGDILAVDMQTHNIKSYHSATNPTGITGTLSAVAFSPQSNTIFVATKTVTTTTWFYSMNLDHAGLPNAWSTYTAGNIPANGYPVSLIPLDNAESSELLIVFANGTAVTVDPFYSTTAFHSVQTTSMTADPDLSLVVDLQTGIYPNILDRRGLITGNATGTIYYTPFNSTQPSFNIPTAILQPFAQILTYRTNGTVWVIIAQNGTTTTNLTTTTGKLVIYDLGAGTTGSTVFSTQTNPVAITIMPDLELIDWLVVAQGNGAIVKYNLATIKTNPTPFTILPPDYLHPFSEVLSLHSNWKPVAGFNGTQILPVLVVVSKSGEITALPSGTSHWTTLLRPSDLEDPTAKIVDVHFVQLSFDDYIQYGVPAYQLQVILDDGHVLVQGDTTDLFTSGSPTLTSNLLSVKQYDYVNGVTSRQIRGEQSTDVGTLSFSEICSLIQMNTEIYVELASASTGETLRFRVVGYETSSNPSRTDVQNVILLPQVSATQKAIRFSFWTPQEISQGFDTLLEYVDVGLDIFDFVWTVTSLFL